MINRLGVMQGRLVEPSPGKIQEFPKKNWESEFPILRNLGIHLLEWTIDWQGIDDNPILSESEIPKILKLQIENELVIPSATLDCFMQFPCWHDDFSESSFLRYKILLENGRTLGLKYLVLPLVDASSINSDYKLESLFDFCKRITPHLISAEVQIIFESDYSSLDLLDFISKFDSRHFGVNYDIGNSASLGYSPKNEIENYGDWIKNVHVKDRVLGGSTVPLGEGSADFETVFGTLASINYAGNFILQTARSSTGDHVGVIEKYRDMTLKWMDRYGL
jgi:L-ribulose-5-phosphate 3-epimerase